jgi:hypothetical protein
MTTDNHTSALVEAAYYKASSEVRKMPWQAGYFSYKIAKHARGGHSHEELVFHPAVIEAYKERYGNAGLDEIIRGEEFVLLPRTSHEDCAPVLLLGVSYCFSSSERDGGVRFKKTEVVMHNPGNWDTLVVTRNMSRAVAMLAFCISLNGLAYDWRGVGGFKLSFLNENPDKWYCTEACDKAKELMGMWPKKIYRSHPSVSFSIQKYITGRQGGRPHK